MRSCRCWRNWRIKVKRRVLLTGARGFVGRQVRLRLENQYDLHCTSRRAVAGVSGTWHSADLRDPDACAQIIERVRPELLVHTAWNTEHGEFWEAEDNEAWLRAGCALFTAFAESGGKRIVACGSCAEYPGASDFPRREDEAIAPDDAGTRYGSAKLALLEHLRALPVEYAWARIFFAYGPHEDRRRLVPSVIRSVLRGAPASTSSGRQLRDFIDVRDLGRAIALLVDAPLKGVINLGHGTRTTIATLASTIGELAGRPDLIRLGELPDRPGEALALVPDLTRQTSELRFLPEIGLREGLEDAIAFWATQN
jgi:nucleoside-diphosphate-sugar epimerase